MRCVYTEGVKTNSDTSVAVVSKLGEGADLVVGFAVEGEGLDGRSRGLLGAGYCDAADRMAAAGVLTGKSKELAVAVVGEGKKAHRFLVVGLGKREGVSAQGIREAAGLAAGYAKKNSQGQVAMIPPAVGLVEAEAAGVVTGGFVLGAFRFTEYNREAREKEKSVSLQVVAGKGCANEVLKAQLVAEAQNFARFVAFWPGNELNPVTLAALCARTARQVGLKCRVMDQNQLKKLGMGGILAVGEGAKATPPRMIVLEHRPRGVEGAPVLLVGKTVTFDTGGISIKPAEKMGRMIFDKCGGMAVLGTMLAIARLKLPVAVVGILAAAENHISDRAYRPGDILRMYNGVSVEVTNTDAEGRLVLGDAMAWGCEEYGPRVCVDLATLTGGVSVALGRTMAGIMGNDQKLMDELIATGKDEGEKMWQLPLPEEPTEMLKSDFADVVNSAGRDAHPLQGAAFLSLFLPKEPKVAWAHLDIAGVADTEKELPLYAKGATGWGVRTLVRWLERMK